MIKKVAGAYYAHKSNIDELLSFIPLKHRELVFAVCELCDKEYTVVKYTEEAVTLIYSPDWDTANEPEVGVQYRYKLCDVFNNNLEYKVLPGRGQIYHNKWQFVSDDYSGFDIGEAKDRTLLWNAIPNIKAHKSKIGYKKYWVALLKMYNIPI